MRRHRPTGLCQVRPHLTDPTNLAIVWPVFTVAHHTWLNHAGLTAMGAPGIEVGRRVID
jgi:hypothetical protein